MTSPKYELLRIPREHLAKLSDYTPYFKFINKAYDRIKFQYDFIWGQRIKTTTSFMEDFLITDRDFTLFVLLGPESMPDRKFENSHDLKLARDCDVDLKVKASDIVLKEIDIDTFDLSAVLYRVLGSAAYIDMDSTTVELTGFTSFANRVGVTILEISLKLLPPTKKLLQASCICNHNVVDYYVKYCKFLPPEKEGQLVTVEMDKENGDRYGLSKSITVVYIYRHL